MVIGLFTIAAIPSVIGVAEGVSRRDEGSNPETSSKTEEERMRKFNLECYCEDTGRKASTINGGRVVLRDEKIYIDSPSSSSKSHPLEAFYIAYPDPDRPKPPPLGLVSTISNDPPMLNWIYVDKDTREVKYGNRTQSKPHIVGSWGWEAGEEGGPGGLTLEGDEGAAAVETDRGWEVRWEDEDGKIPVKGTSTLRISLERKMLEPTEEEKEKEAAVKGEQTEKRTDTKAEVTKTKFKGSRKTTDESGVVAKTMIREGKENSKEKPKLEISSTTVEKPIKGK